MTNDARKSYKVKSVAKTFRIIEFLKENDGANLQTISDEVEVSKTTAHNHISTLQRLGYVVEEGGKYYPGFRFIGLSEYVLTRKREYELMSKKVDELADETEERIQLIVNGNGIGVCLANARGRQGVTTEPRVGSHMYLHASAAGKAILAGMENKRVEQILNRWGLPKLTDETITDRSQLFQALEKIRERGYAYNNRETIDQIRAVAVAINVPYQEPLGAISVGGPTHRLQGTYFKESLPELLLGIKDELEVNIAHS